MQLSNEELQYIANTIDTHIRANGLNVAATGIIIVAKIKAHVEQLEKDKEAKK